MMLDDPRAEVEGNVVNIWKVFADSIFRVDLSRVIAYIGQADPRVRLGLYPG
jgi:hypothetical protein